MNECPDIIVERRSKLRLLWEYINIEGIPLPVKVFQETIQQEHDACSYAALALHFSYNSRISYAKEVVTYPIQLPDRMLIDHFLWRKEADARAGGAVQTLWSLLLDARSHGVPLMNGLKLRIDWMQFFPRPVNPKFVKTQLNYCTIVVSIKIFSDYSENGEKPYMGRGEVVYKPNDSWIQLTHAVVLVGRYKDKSLFLDNEEKKEKLWVYQNCDGNKQLAFLQEGRNVVRHSLIDEAYWAHTHAPNILLRGDIANEMKTIRD